MSSSAKINYPQPYALEEHVIVKENGIPQHVRFTLELDMIYDPVESDNDHGMERNNTPPVPLLLHPLGHLSSSDALPPQISHVTWTMARRASQSSKMHTAIPSPSGVWLDIVALEPLSESFLNALVQNWMDRRLWLTPIHGSVWDTYDSLVLEGQDQLCYHHQMFFPTNGAAWSADALQQFFTAALPSSYTSFFGISALQWSRWLVEGTTPQAQLYWRWDHHHALLGMQLDLPESLVDIKGPDVASIVLSWMDQTPTYPLTTSKTVHHEQGSQDNSPSMSLEQVVRRTRPNHGRLETWWTADDGENVLDDCSLHLRQRLPPYMVPVWHSLQVDVVDHDDSEGIPPLDDRIVVDRHVEWDKHGSSVLLISLSAIPASVVLSLDYQPAYLSLDDFPGDPNRGREIPPMVATLLCPPTRETLHPATLVSNSVLILPPVPDMSMPFNVLSLTCSLYAYLVGTLVTLLIKRASERVRYTLEPHKKPKSKLVQFKERIQQRFLRRNKNADKDEDKQEGKDKQTMDGVPQTTPGKEDPPVSDATSMIEG